MINTDNPIISLDLETGGLEPGKHSVLSIGAVVVPNPGNFEDKNITYDVTEENSFYVQLEWPTVVVDPRAMQIHKLNIVSPPGYGGDMLSMSQDGTEGLKRFGKWISRLVLHTNQLVYALGVNVGSFDLKMLRSPWNDLNGLFWPFHYRSIDLNSLFFALASRRNMSFSDVKKEITETAWKRSGFSTDMEHHALADAWSNVYVWEECLKQFGGDCEVAC
ncbi:hypothetical protein LCGC14_0140730 [marine sediment metagenome]|uniref:Exonuclease domain-containing protein n=1 Tax=marine sediment metagenome TaxID=412755 RepID=A0A0F9VG86_9ZZZZ